MHPINIACPVCGAQRGLSCRNPQGYPVAGFHNARSDAASVGWATTRKDGFRGRPG